ncbi:general stress protein [Metabacillus arenae]|uniref:General stress protein n=1 Tax=Metabacillus arenae TaxID=2771434 RepID=A0A926S067_9BACI|nr:general stress protein [Metabacillus arenae]MBD1379729.1 general stress protein [Metabacillus arenae]
MKPVVKEYQNEDLLKNDVNDLQARGVSPEDIYVLSHDDERTNRVADVSNASTIGLNEMGLDTAVGNLFMKKGDELRNKIQEVGFSSQEAEVYEEKLDEGKILLFVTDHQKASDWRL